MTIEEFLSKAKELNAKIELIVKADCNDADYNINVDEFSCDEFVEYDIQEVYSMLKLFEGKQSALWQVAEKVYDDDYRRGFFEDVFTPQEVDILVKNWDSYCDYIPANINNECAPCHTICGVELRIVIPYEASEEIYY